MIWNRWFLGGAAIALAFEAPDLWWQAQHQWATIAMTEALRRENGGLVNIGLWVVEQLSITVLSLAGVSMIGLWCLWRSRRPLWRALAWAYGLLFILFALTTGGKGYYLGAAYIYLLAAGAVVIDGWLQARPGRVRNLLLATAVSTAVFVPLVLPVLPAADVGWNSLLREEVGWPQFVRTVDAVWTSLPPGQRARAVVFTENYGEAAAINELGRGTGLPTAVSSQNSEWWWGPGNLRATTVVTVAPGPADVTSYAAYLGQLFVSVRAVATQVNPYGARNQEWGGHVYVCTGPRQPWAQIWPHLRRYS